MKLLIFICAFTGQHWEESGPIFFIASPQVFIYIDQTPPEPSVFQAEESQLFESSLVP